MQVEKATAEHHLSTHEIFYYYLELSKNVCLT